jgi:hypothetical protein
VDPEVVTQFNCLQQTGNFCPSSPNAPSPLNSSMTSSAAMSSGTTSRQAAADAFFALPGVQEDNLGSLETLSAFPP